MGRKSKGRSGMNAGSSIRGMMRGLKNRWGRFQCPRDGSICKSLEAWHWHRHKYHQTEHINYIELDDDSQSATPQPITSSPTSSQSHQHPHPSSPRLLPPEAFAPRRQEVLFPDDASDLTEPEIPVLLSEEVTSREEAPSDGGPEVVRWEEMDEATSVVDEEIDSRIRHNQEATTDSRTLLQDHARDGAASRLHGNDSHGNQESKTTRDSRNEERVRDFLSLQSPSRETNSRHHGNDSHGNQRQRHDRSCSRDRSVDHSVPLRHCPTTASCPTTSSSALDLVALFVLSLLQREGGPQSAQDILCDVESRFAGLGLSREGLQGVVTGALMGFKDQWTKAYNAGWKDGAKEVLNAPLLRSIPPLHSPVGAPTPNSCAHETVQVTLLTPPGQISVDEKEGTLAAKISCRGDSIEGLETSVERMRDFSAHHLGNDLNNNDAILMT